MLQIQRLEKQLFENHYRLNVSERAIDAICHEGYDPTYGARPLKRVIQRRLQNKIATELLRKVWSLDTMESVRDLLPLTELPQ